jgi:hypothetical protein
MAESESSSKTGDGITDLVLRWGEVCIVVLIAVVVIAATLYQVLWIVFAMDWPTREARLSTSLRMLNEDWKVGLILLVPLFYRTIRAFLERVEEAFGMKAPRVPVVGSVGANPQPRTDGEAAERAD